MLWGAAPTGALSTGDYPKVVVPAPVIPPPTPTPTPEPVPAPKPKVPGQIVPPVQDVGPGNTFGFSGLDQFYQALDSFYDDLRREQERLARKKKRKKKKGELPAPVIERMLGTDPATLRVAPPRFDSEAEDLYLLFGDLLLAEEEGRI